MNDKEIDALLTKANSMSDVTEREAKTLRIMSDPAPQYSPDPIRDYPTTEKHYIMVEDEEKANASMPDALKIYGVSHKLGGVLISDRLNIPDGFIKMPPRGSSIEQIKDISPTLFNFLANEKKVANF